MNRRDFLKAGTAGLTFMGLGGYVAAAADQPVKRVGLIGVAPYFKLPQVGGSIRARSPLQRADQDRSRVTEPAFRAVVNRASYDHDGWRMIQLRVAEQVRHAIARHGMVQKRLVCASVGAWPTRCSPSAVCTPAPVRSASISARGPRTSSRHSAWSAGSWCCSSAPASAKRRSCGRCARPKRARR